ncbi:MAG: alpha/beta hydrolase [Myxococcota bacterium]
MKAIFLHGVPTDGRLWDPVRRHLDDVEIQNPDLPGYGQQPPLSHPTLDAHLVWMDDVLPDPRGHHLVGQDFGGLLAALWAVRRGARSVTLTSSPADLLWLWPRIAALPVVRYPFYERFGGRLYLSRGCAPEVRERFVAQFMPGVQREGLSLYMRRTAEGISARALARLPGQLRRSRIPTLCLWGDADRFHPPPIARWTARRIGAEVRWVAGGRHYAPYDRPAAYAEQLQAFWLRAGGATG